MKIQETDLKDVMVISPDKFEDHRGEFIEIYNEEDYTAVKDIKFVQDDISVSSRHVLRGLHGDDRTWKLVSCLYGRFYLVVVNCDQESSNFGQWLSFTLSDRNRQQVLIPPKHGNGHLVLSDTVIFHYKQSEYYDRDSQFTYRWDDSQFNIWWPIKDPILSERDFKGS